METTTANKRIEFIDLAKGVCILLVTIGHTGIDVDLPGLANMRMPLYFILSGLFFKNYGGLRHLMTKKVNKIIIPFTFFYVISYLLFYLFEYVASGLIKTDAAGIMDMFTQRQFFNGPIWFLLALFWANLMFGVISLIIKNEVLRAMAVMIIGGIGAVVGFYEVFLPCNIDSAMTALPFFYFGYLLKKTPLLYPNKFDKWNWVFILLLYGVSLGLYYMFDNPRVALHYNTIIGNWLVILIMAMTSVMAVLFLCKMIDHLPFISYFGRYSIIPLCVHHLIYRPVKLLLVNFSISGKILVTLFTVIISWACIPLCIKFLPYVTAQKDLIKTKY